MDWDAIAAKKEKEREDELARAGPCGGQAARK